MKILFLARHFAYLRNFESVIVECASRGHDVHLAVEREETLGGRGMVERIAARFPNVTIGRYPLRHRRREDGELLRNLRLGTDYLRFLDARYDRTPHLRTRATERAPETIVTLSRLPLIRRKPVRAAFAAVLRWLERGAPPPAAVDAYLREQAPDLLLLTPLIDLGSPQADLFARAYGMGLRTCLCVGSWDHLSSKSLLRAVPDLVLVWNKAQRQEAMEMHGVPASRITVTGAQAYDHWFGWQPSRSREAFCRRVGLPPDRPYILYVCSSLFYGTASEPVFVEKWIRHIRESDDPLLNRAGILIRPHPTRVPEWEHVDLSVFGDVVFWGAHPVDEHSKADYFESMHYASAVVGLNTSAFLEAGVLGKSVFTVLLPRYSKNNQEGTIHFHYLLNIKGGLLHAARSFDEHVEQLRERLAQPDAPDPRSLRFTEAFIRPLGLDVPATPVFVDALERAAKKPVRRRRGVGVLDFLARLAWRPAASLLDLQAERDVPKAPPPSASGGQPTAPRRLKVSSLAPKVRKARDADRQFAGTDTQQARETRALVERLASTDAPILIGPWVSEAGFELMYWIPFLRWACAHGRIDPQRVTVVSRGGSAPWYRPFAAHYEDAFSFVTPDEFRVRVAEDAARRGGRLKHLDMSAFDREIIAKVKDKRGLLACELLHPSVMYRLFEPFWMQRVPITLVDIFSEFALLPEAPDEAAIRRGLPERYVVAKFYANGALPDTPENRAFVSATLERLTEAGDVVLLNTGIRFDDHDDYPKESRGRLHTLEHVMRPDNNLAVQTAVIRGAEAYVGTYGGFSYVAPLCGTSAVTFYSHPEGFRFDHLEVAKRVFAGLHGGSFTEVDLRGLGALHRALADGAPANVQG
ncbi:MAG: hypothetical protein HY824_05115 [Acidobacteria bacterium]|nr:hypothetical protein [Acidobacteriota bacterium]